jgi:holin-like protein
MQGTNAARQIDSVCAPTRAPSGVLAMLPRVSDRDRGVLAAPLAGLTALLVCQLAGELVTRALDLPVPGPVIGMALLFAGLSVRGRVPAGIDAISDRLLANLSLLCVPAGVGVTKYLGLIADEWVPILVALFAGTLVTLAEVAVLARVSLPDEE